MGWPSFWGLSGEAITRGNSNEPFARAEECTWRQRDWLVTVLLRKREDLGATAGRPRYEHGCHVVLAKGRSVFAPSVERCRVPDDACRYKSRRAASEAYAADLNTPFVRHG